MPLEVFVEKNTEVILNFIYPLKSSQNMHILFSKQLETENKMIHKTGSKWNV